MRRNVLRLFMAALMSLFLWFPTVSIAATPTVSQFSYNAQSHLLSGRTAPNSTINVDGMAGTIVSDANGYFEVPIPKPMKTVKLFIINQNGEDNAVVYHITDQTGHTHNNDLAAQNCPVKPEEHHNQQAANDNSAVTEQSQDVSTDSRTLVSSSSESSQTHSSINPSTSSTKKNETTSTATGDEKEHSSMPWGIIGIGVAIGLLLLFIIYKIRHRYHRKH